MSDECRFEQADEGMCSAHELPAALCTHAAAALREKVRRLLAAGRDDLAAYNELQDEAAALRVRVDGQRVVIQSYENGFKLNVTILALEARVRELVTANEHWHTRVEQMKQEIEGLQHDLAISEEEREQ